MSIPAGSLKLHYDFSDPTCYPGTGNTIYDISGNGVNATNTNAVFKSTGDSSYFQFNGTNSVITTASYNQTSKTVFTYNVWVQHSGTSWGFVYVTGIGALGPSGGGSPGLNVNQDNTDEYMFQFGNGIGKVLSPSSSSNTWTMYTTTADGTTVKIYKNGVLINSTSQGSGAIDSGAQTTRIGAYDNTGLFLNGKVATFQYYNAALSSGDILTLYNNTKARFPLNSYDFSNSLSYSGSGNTVYDLAGNLNLPIVNGTTFVSNGQASYFSFDGSNDYIGKTGVTGLGTTFTISFWAQQNTSNPQVPFSCGYVGGGGRGVQFTFSGTISYDLSASFNFGIGYVNSLSTHSPNTWDMYTYTCDGTTSKLYINGVIQGSDTQDSAFWDTGSFAIGANTNSSGNITTGGDSLNGKIALLDVYNTALGSTDINNIYNAQSYRFDSLVASYDFSDPLCYPGTGNTVYDLSGSELDLPISGATFVSDGTASYFSFDGSNDYIGKNGVTGLGSTFTISAWSQCNNSSDGSIFVSGTGLPPSNAPAIFYNNPTVGSISGSFNWGTGLIEEPFPQLTWQNIVYTADGTNAKLYVDGVLQGTVSQGAGNWPTGGFNLGRSVDASGNVGGNPLNGKIALLDVYNVALGSTDVANIYSNYVNRFYGKIYSYDFSDPACYPGTGNTVYDLIGTNDLPIVNSSYTSDGQASYFNFNGSSSYLGYLTGITGVGNTFSIDIWFQTTSYASTASPFFAGSNGGGFTGPTIYTDTVGGNPVINGSFNFALGYVETPGLTNTWTNIVYTGDGTTAKLYKDGSLVGSASQGIGYWNNGSFLLGRNSGGAAFLSGKIATFDVYNVALGSTAILDNYNTQAPRFDNLVASYDFSDSLCYSGSGNTVYDLSGSGLDLPISGATFGGTGQSKYFNFDGSSYIGAKNLNLLPSDNTFSMNIWAKKDAAVSAVPLFLLSIGANPGPSGTNPYITANEYTEKYTVQFSNGIGIVNSTSEIPNSVWTMITYTADGTNSKIYIDGVLDGTASQGIGSNPSSNATLYIGAVTDGSNNPLGSNRFTGDVAIVEIYNTALSAGDITTIYNDQSTRFSPAPPPYSGNVGGRQFNQGFNG